MAHEPCYKLTRLLLHISTQTRVSCAPLIVPEVNWMFKSITACHLKRCTRDIMRSLSQTAPGTYCGIKPMLPGGYLSPALPAIPEVSREHHVIQTRGYLICRRAGIAPGLDACLRWTPSTSMRATFRVLTCMPMVIT